MKFKFPAVEHKTPIYPIETEMGRIRDMPDPVTWAEKHFKLSSAYAQPGDFKAYPWQHEIIRAVLDYEVITLCGPVQSFKSLACEIMIAYCIDNLPMNAIFCYSKREVVHDVFEERVKPLITDLKAIKKYWSGNEKDLTRRKMKLAHMYMRVGSSEVKSDIATFGSGLAYGSEVSKWRKKRGWDPVESLKRRQEAYRLLGRHRLILESSPLFEGDILDEEMKRSGVLNLEPHYPCPRCGRYQVLTYTQIKELPGKNGKADHDPNRIRRDNAAQYECRYCRGIIEETDRMAMDTKVVWAAKGEGIARDGKVVNRRETKAVSFKWSRLVDFTFSFVECLARFFEARRKGIEALQTFINEDMGMFWKEKSKRVSDDYLLKKCAGYYQYKARDIPNDVLVLVLGADAQDDGFYFVVNGYGRGMVKYLVRSGFVECKIDLSVDGKQPSQVAYERFRAAVYEIPYIRRDEKKLDIYFGLIDRGGHRPKDVDYICARMPKIEAYIGLATINPKNPMIEKSKNGEHYNGQSQLISREVGHLITSDNFKLPDDIQPDYLEQVRNEYFETKISPFGNKKPVYVKIIPNHYRSCENYCHAATLLEEYGGYPLRDWLFDESVVTELDREPSQITDEPAERDGPDSEYFARRRYQ